MTTVALHADEALLEKATAALDGTDLTLDEVFARSLYDLAKRKESIQRFEDMAARLRAEGVTIPILTREERNARR